MSRLALTGAVTPLWMLLGVFLCYLFAFWVYRRTNPPVQAYLRRTLAILRGTALSLVWLFAVNLTWHWSILETEKSTLAVLVDQSSSMSEVDRAGNRWETLNNIIDGRGFREIEGIFDVEWYRFAETLKKVNRNQVETPPTGTLTNLQRALEVLPGMATTTPDAVLLLSDGGVNSGGSVYEAAEELAVPIYTVGIGDSLEQTDVHVRSVTSPASIYLEDSLGLAVELTAAGVEGELQLTVEDETGNRVAQTRFEVEPGVKRQERWISFVPARAGVQQFTVNVSQVEGEVNRDNNRGSVAVDVRSRRRRVLLLAGHPDPDVAALARALENDPDSDTRIVIGAGISPKTVRGSWEEIDPSALDLLIVYADGPWPGSGVASLRRVLQQDHPLLLLTGSDPAQVVLSALEPRSGPSRNVPQLESARPRAVREFPLLTPAGTLLRGGDPTLSLSEIEFLDADILMLGEGTGAMRPLLQIRQTPARTLLFSCSDLADLALYGNQGGGGQSAQKQDFSEMLSRWILWLTSPEQQRYLSVKPALDVVSRGATAVVNINAFSSVGRPPGSGDLAISVTGPEGNVRDLAAVEMRSGEYVASFVPWTPGRYSVEVSAEVDGEPQRVSTTLFAEPFSLERAESRMRPEVLRQLAGLTHGAYLEPDSVGTIVDLLPQKRTVREVTGLWRPLGRWFTLLAAVALLALEWAIRLRRGLM